MGAPKCFGAVGLFTRGLAECKYCGWRDACEATIILAGGTLADRLDGAQFMLYSGAPPVKVQDPPTGTLLATEQISATATGTGARLVPFQMQVLHTATAGYFRIVHGGEVVLTGSVGESGADLNISNPNLIYGERVHMGNFYIKAEG